MCYKSKLVEPVVVFSAAGPVPQNVPKETEEHH